MIDNIDHDFPKRILDVGCCESLLPEELLRRGHMVYGIDIREYPNPKNFEFYRADITDVESFPFDPESFDYVISLSTIEHIGLGYYGGDLDERGDRIAVRNIHSLLRSDGHFIVTLLFSGKYYQNSFQRVHTMESFKDLISGYFEIEKQQFWIPKSKKNWIPATLEEAELVYESCPENNACFVLKKL